MGKATRWPVICASYAPRIISSAASLHLYSTVTNAVRPHEYSTEFSGPKEVFESLFQQPIVVKDGDAELPNRPGLGLELDMRTVERLKA